MGYMFNKQFRGYNTEEVDETIASLEKNIQDRSLQIRRLEEELEKIKKRILRWQIVSLLNERPMRRFPVLL